MNDEQVVETPAPAAEATDAEPTWGEIIKRAEAKAEAFEAEHGSAEASDEPEQAEPEVENGEDDSEPANDNGDEDDSDGAVVPAERVKFRAEKREWRQKLKAQQQDFDAKVRAAEEYYAPMLKAKKLWETGRYEDAVEAAFGVDISDLNTKVIEREQGKDPRVDAMERELREYKENEERIRAERQKAAEEADRQRAVDAHKGELKGAFTGSSNELIARAAEHQEFIDQVFAEQEKEWDEYEQTTIDPSEAAERVLDQYRKAHSALGRILYGDPSAANDGVSPRGTANRESPAREGANPAKPVRKRAPKVVNRQQAAEASPPGDLDEKAWARKYTEMLKQAEA